MLVCELVLLANRWEYLLQSNNEIPHGNIDLFLCLFLIVKEMCLKRVQLRLSDQCAYIGTRIAVALLAKGYFSQLYVFAHGEAPCYSFKDLQTVFVSGKRHVK